METAVLSSEQVYERKAADCETSAAEKRSESTPLVSVIMPAYNAEKYIEQAIRSVQKQTVRSWELIVVDDRSTDKTAEQIRRLAAEDMRIIPVYSETNHGAAESRNIALRQCRGEFVALLDADDVWHPQKLERELERARETDADLVYSSYAMIDEQGTRCFSDFIVEESTDLQSMLNCNTIGCSTVLMKAKVLEKRPFVTDFYHEDYVMWLSLLQAGCKAVGVRDILVDYRVARGSRSFNKLKSAKNRWRVYRDYLKLPLIPSVKAMAGYAINGLKKYR
ncbi:glycosyltransferase family 2 protein [Vescimonas sp.]|uniref:glycosyltransferase family 2 protein n=1 Tax=Vescimonas sp. TaxID=2892404 RepID=UPI003F8086C9